MGRAPTPDFGTIFRATPGMYLVLTPGFEIIEATESWLRHTQMRRSQALGRNLFDVLAESPEQRAAAGPRELRESLERVLRLGHPDAMPMRRYDIRRADGGFDERYWTLLNVPVNDGQYRVGWIIHRVRDVTELARLHREGGERDELEREQQLLITRLRAANEELARRDRSLSESERRLAIAMEAGRLGSWEMTLADRAMTSSALHKACYGRGPDELFTHDELRASVHPDDRPRRQVALDAALLSGADYDVEYRTVWPDGSVHWVQIRGQVIRDADGAPERMVGVSQDISDRKRSEELLEQRVVTRTRDLAEANARLTAAVAERDQAERALQKAQRLEAIGQLTGGVAHDFNNLLAAVIGNLELLRARLPDDKLGRHVEGALSAAWRGGRLTQQLLAFARQQRLEPGAVDVNTLITGMDSLLRHTLGGLVQVEVELAPELWPASTDATQLELVVLNLVINARDAMPEGGRLCISTANRGAGEPVPSELTAGDYVVISVGDTGTGMSPEVQERAFEPFFTTKGVGKGSGLGLAQAYGVARQSGGTVRLDSRLGVGTLVEVFLPRAGVTAKADPAECGPGEPVEPIAATVLLLDDEPDVRAVACELLSAAGHRVAQAASGDDALALLYRRRFDIAVVDHAMPGMSGVEFVRLARRVQPALPVLFIAGNPDMIDPAAIGPGERVLSKPYGRTELLRALGALLPVAAG
ncbi:MAG TPA: PAS domain-containing protein [Acetobacteraceae bacterium]|nr:PAS domain-containing protein [Acetobacteraceae bacterium]